MDRFINKGGGGQINPKYVLFLEQREKYAEYSAMEKYVNPWFATKICIFLK
jgi:hypothetical protein